VLVLVLVVTAFGVDVPVVTDEACVLPAAPLLGDVDVPQFKWLGETGLRAGGEYPGDGSCFVGAGACANASAPPTSKPRSRAVWRTGERWWETATGVSCDGSGHSSRDECECECE